MAFPQSRPTKEHFTSLGSLDELDTRFDFLMQEVLLTTIPYEAAPPPGKWPPYDYQSSPIRATICGIRKEDVHGRPHLAISHRNVYGEIYLPIDVSVGYILDPDSGYAIFQRRISLSRGTYWIIDCTEE